MKSNVPVLRDRSSTRGHWFMLTLMFRNVSLYISYAYIYIFYHIYKMLKYNRKVLMDSKLR